MMKRLVCFVLLLGMVSISALASSNFDISVFQNNENYEVTYDDMNDTGRVELTNAKAMRR